MAKRTPNSPLNESDQPLADGGLPTVPIGTRQFTEEQLVDYLVESVDNNELLQERLAELEFALEDRDWVRLNDYDSQVDFSAWALKRIIDNSRVAFLHNPLINHGVEVKADYVWSQSMSVIAEGEGQTVVEKWMAHPRNERVLTSHLAQLERNRQLDLEGNIFVTLPSNDAGDVIVRLIPTDEVLSGDIICNPEDKYEPWYYKRRHKVKQSDGSWKDQCDYYPDIRYNPTDKPEQYGETSTNDRGEVHWDMPTFHIKDGGLPGAKWGVPTVYQSIDWAREVKRDLEAYATIRRALASFAFKLKTKGGSKAIAAAKDRLHSTLSGSGDTVRDDNSPSIMGATWIEGEGRDLQPIRTAGMTPSPEEGRRLWNMTAAGMGLPETILAGDADVGNLATAKTLDRPTELMMENRRSLWIEVFETVLQYVILKKASGSNTPDMNQPDLPEVVVSFPSLLEPDRANAANALLSALTYDGKSLADWAKGRPKIVARLMLDAVGADDIDELLNEFFEEQPEGGEKQLVDDAKAQADAMQAQLGAAGPPAEGAVAEVLRHMVETRAAARNGAS